MKRNWWYRFTFLLLATGVSIYVTLPTFFDFKETDNYPVKSKINLGLDLQGGLYMILGIDFKKVYVDEVKTYARRLELLAKDEANINFTIAGTNTNDQLDPRQSMTFTNPGDVQKVVDLIHQYYQGYLRVTTQTNDRLEIALSKVNKTQIEEQALSKSIEVIRNRIDEFGVTEPEITSQGNDRIIVQLPGVKDIERAKELIGRTAKLEFKLVNEEVSMVEINGWLAKAKEAGIEYKKGDRFSQYVNSINEFLKKELPEGYMLAFEKTVNKFNNEVEISIPYLVDTAPRLTGDALEDARVTIDQQNQRPVVSFVLKSNGAKVMGELSGNNIGKRMAIILDGNVYSAPAFQSKITSRGQITLGTGNYDKLFQEARDLAIVLRAGALPVQLDFLEQRTVGPSLGQDSISKARYASMIGIILVFVFILMYYKASGMVAMITLGLNVLFVLAALVGLEATLTLPGIAGIALTIGMAVDANIIIYERIREEVRAGSTNYKSVDKGFEQAFWTIIDANITTALAGFCLLNFGTGPIRGFAVTLLIGIMATVYTSYFCGKLLFEFYMNKVEGQQLSI